MNRGFTVMNPDAIKRDYPKSYKAIIEWLKHSSPEGNVVNEQIVQAFIYGNPRFLYDFFDDNDLLISIDAYRTGFEIKINQVRYVDVYKNRKEAEESAFKEVLIDLEEKLNIVEVN